MRGSSERPGPALRIAATDRLAQSGGKQAARRSRFTEEQSIPTSPCPMFGAKGSVSATHVMHRRHASGDIRHGSKPGAVTGGYCCNPNPCAIRTKNGPGCPIIKDLWAREGSPAVAFPPPLAPTKAFSRSGCGRIFPLFSGVMQDRLLTGTLPRRPESVLSAPIFSRPVACAVLVNRYQTSVYQGNYSDVNPTWMGVASGADTTRVELSADPSPLILQPALRPVPFRPSRSRWSRCEARQRED